MPLTERRQVDVESMKAELMRLYALDPEARILTNLLRHLADPVRPRSTDGKFRPHPLLLLLGLVGITVLFTFVYFSAGAP
jgi:hypothetical protein